MQTFFQIFFSLARFPITYCRNLCEQTKDVFDIYSHSVKELLCDKSFGSTNWRGQSGNLFVFNESIAKH